MGCGCGKRRATSSTATATPTVRGAIYVVYVNGESTGRRFTSIVAARSYADRVGGEVRDE